MYEFKAGSTSKTIYVKLVDSTTFLGKTGLLFSDMTISYILAGAAVADVTEATLASASAAWATGGFILVDDTKCPGVYRFDPPNAAIATGPFCIVTFKATGVKDEAVLIKLPAYDPYDSVRLGLTALPNAAAGANTGLPVVGTQVPNATAGAAGGMFIAGANAATSIATALTANVIGNVTGAVSGAVGSVTGNVGGNVTGSVGSVAGLTAADVGAIKAKTDSLTFTKALELDVNIQSINGVQVNGTGVTGDEFEP